MKISIIIPAYNEEKRIGVTLKSYGEFLDQKSRQDNFDYEIIVSINNTRDNTEGVVKSFQAKNEKISYLNLIKGGKGYAIKEGFKDALTRESDFIGFVDADMATPPEAFYYLIKASAENNYDGVIASRYIKGSRVIPKYSFRRTVVSRLFNVLVRSLFLMNYTDTQCGAKLFRRRSLERIIDLIEITQWAFDVEMLYLCDKNGFRVKEIKTIWSEISDQGRLKLGRASIQMFFAVWQLRVKYSPLRHLRK
jgi:dolichyl-phosphate beta-glucosyltransferase